MRILFIALAFTLCATAVQAQFYAPTIQQYPRAYEPPPMPAPAYVPHPQAAQPTYVEPMGGGSYYITTPGVPAGYCTNIGNEVVCQ